MAEEHSLPGWPKKKLVKDVRRHLSHYGIRPLKFTIWQATWSWAYAIARSYYHLHWPSPSEIGTQYILLLLIEMQQSYLLRLPCRAKEILPAEVAAMLPALHERGFPAIETAPAKLRSKRKPNDEANRESSQQKLFQDV